MKIVIDLKLENWNEIIRHCRGNKVVANTYKKKEMKNISYFLWNMSKIEHYPVKITCYWHIKNKLSDLDNKSIKSLLDCMQKMGKLENDNVKCINEIVYKYVEDNKDYLEVEIE